MHFLITGTDTGVGKSFITFNIAKALRYRGVKVACLKPIETGVKDIPSDGKLLSEATGQPLEEVVPITFSLPLAPYSAALEEGRDIDLQLIKERFEELKARNRVVLVEGAGGVSVPIVRGYDYSDLARDLGLKVILVARAGLGTINHTYLTYFYLKAKGLDLAGIVMNGFRGVDVSERTNPKVVKELTGFEPVKIPFSESLELREEFLNSLASLVGF
jgi:dethiobiotin synthetase